MPSARRAAVVKSGVLRFSTTCWPAPKSEGTLRSTVAPLGMRPLLGTLSEMREPSLPFTPKPLTDQASLADRVDLAVDAAHRRHEQGAAAQAAGVADRSDRDVDGLARLGERRQIRMHGHRGNVLQLRIHVRGNGHAELGEHVADALDGERRLARLVARAVEADHEAVADELVVAHALHGGDVLHALGMGEARGQRQSTSGEGALQESFHQNGIQGELKKRASRPGLLALASAPLPP